MVSRDDGKPSDEWQCSQCTYVNADGRKCKICNCRRSSVQSSSPALPPALPPPDKDSKTTPPNGGNRSSGARTKASHTGQEGGLQSNSVGSFVMPGLPEELFTKEAKDRVIRSCDDDYVIRTRVEAGLKNAAGRIWPSLQVFLAENDLAEIETLNGIAQSGACQFSSVAHQLWGGLAEPGWRPDVHLRRLALELVRVWHERFREFFHGADKITRQSESVGGTGLEVDGWLLKMSYLRSDGDHITAQALSDAFQCAICIVKWSAPGTVSLITAVRPRPLPLGGLSRGKVPMLEVPDRVLWVSLHGEAHYRSLRAIDITAAERQAAKSERQTRILERCFQHHRVLCGVCNEVVSPTELCWPLECSQNVASSRRHVFHQACLQQHCIKNKTCPKCKKDITAMTTEDGKTVIIVREEPEETAKPLLPHQIRTPITDAAIKEHNCACFVCGIEGAPEETESKQNGGETCETAPSLLECTSCSLSFHLQCLQPPLEAPPAQWHCPQCVQEQDQLRKQLLEHRKAMQEVAQGLNQGKAAQMGNFTMAETAPSEQSESKEDVVELDCERCFACTHKDEGLLQCEFCSLQYHLQCLKPPLQQAPVGKWCCPECIHERKSRRATLLRRRRACLASGKPRSLDSRVGARCFECVQSGGQLLSCSTCPMTYHLQCLNPTLSEQPSGPWDCPLCVKDKRCNDKPSIAKDASVKPKDASVKPSIAKDASVKPSIAKDVSGKPKDASVKPSLAKDASVKPKDASGKPSIAKDASVKPSIAKDVSGKPKDASGKPSLTKDVSVGPSAKGVAEKKASPSKKHGSPLKDLAPKSVKRQCTEKVLSEVSTASENNDECFKCEGGGVLVCCSFCSLSFHAECVQPPLQRIPDGDWECDECISEAREAAGARGPMGAAAVGWKIKVHWPKMKKWYTARVVEYEQVSRLHQVKYTYDGVLQDEPLDKAGPDMVQWICYGPDKKQKLMAI